MGCGCGNTAKIGIMGQIKHATNGIRSIVGGTAIKLNDTQYRERIRRCMQCENMNIVSGRCGICGCFIKIKAKYDGKYFNCPKGYWSE